MTHSPIYHSSGTEPDHPAIAVEAKWQWASPELEARIGRILYGARGLSPSCLRRIRTVVEADGGLVARIGSRRYHFPDLVRRRQRKLPPPNGVPAVKRRRRPSLARTIAAAKKAGASSITTPDGCTIRFGEPAGDERDEWDTVLPHVKN